MKFKVRAGFHLHHNYTVTKVDGSKSAVTKPHAEGEEIELDAAGAKLHAMRIEGTDAESIAYLDSLVVSPPPPQGGAEITPAALAAALAQVPAETLNALVAARGKSDANRKAA